MELLVILTLSQPTETGVQHVTITRTVVANPASTRLGLLNWALTQAPAEMQTATILFFSAQPNALGGGR